MMYIQLNTIEMRRLIHECSSCGLMDYIRIHSVYNIISFFSLIQLKIADIIFMKEKVPENASGTA